MFIFLLIAGEAAGLATVLLSVLNYGEFTFLWVLPAAFMLVFPLYMYMAEKAKTGFFYFLFAGVLGLRYVVHPFLVAWLRDFREVAIQTELTMADANEAVWLMVYELCIVTPVLFLIFTLGRKNEERKRKELGWKKGSICFVYPKKTGIYWLMIAGTAVCVVLFPKALSFFSFAIFTFSGVSSGSLNLFEQGTVVLIIAAKYFLQLLLMMQLKYWRDRTGKKIFSLVALGLSLLFGCFYYGINRMVFIFTFVSSIILYRLLFRDFWKLILMGGLAVGIVVFGYATRQRNYTDFYADLSGFDHTLHSLKVTLNAYLGGVANVAVSIVNKRQYGANAGIGMFLYDLVRPIVGLNKLLPVRDLKSAGYYFNEVFFQSTLDPCQIIPTVGHGFYYLGFWLAPLADVLFLAVFGASEYLVTKTKRIELFFIFLMISMRMSMMCGINITILNNELSMQIFLSLAVYILNELLPLGSDNPVAQAERKVAV